MLTMTEPIVYLRTADHPAGRFLPLGQARIGVTDRGFMLADGVYEVVRSYGGRHFRLEDHMARLQRSLDAVRIGGIDAREIGQLAQELADRNGMASCDAMVYIQVTRGEAPRSHAFPDPSPTPTVFMSASGTPDCSREQSEGISVKLLSDFRWTRCDIKSVALLANVLALQYARESGTSECVFVRGGVVTEGTHTSFFAVVDGTVRTHPNGNLILPGITRAGVLELCRSEGIPSVEEAIPETDLARASEAFIAATSYEVTPVVRIGNAPVGDGRPGPITCRLQRLFAEITRP